MSGECGAPPTEGEYDSETATLVVQYLLSPRNLPGTVSSATTGLDRAALDAVYVLRGRGKDKVAVAVAQYSDDLGALKKYLPEDAGQFEFGLTKVGKVATVVDVALTAYDEWGQTAGHPTYVRVGYTGFETAAKAGGAAAFAWAGGEGGAALGSAILPGLGTIAGGVLGAVGGGIFGAWFGDHASDLIWEVKPVG